MTTGIGKANDETRHHEIHPESVMLLHILLALCASTRLDQEFQALDLDPLFVGMDGCFVFSDLAEGQEPKYSVYRQDACLETYPPFSTFKVPNSLIALHTEVIAADESLPWDGQKHPVRSWEQDHQLASAFSNSVVWFYQELARRVGREQMQKNLARLQYGNQQIGPAIDQFWLDGTLQISSLDQVAFLRKLWHGKLPYDEATMQSVRDLMIQEQAADYCLRGKTGSGRHNDQALGWFVGYLESGDMTIAFATKIAGEGCHGRKAQQITRAVLIELGLMPGDANKLPTPQPERQS